MTTVGSLCTGYDGLGLVTKALWPDAETVFVSDVDRHVNEWLEARLPDVPNLGDFTQLDALPPCDVLTAGFPCQPASTAGQRKGIDDDRWLWPAIERTIRAMDRPPAVVLLENVPGLLTVNSGHAMADVVGGLASLGYVGSYGIMGARDVGACHRRDRLWIAATDSDDQLGDWTWGAWDRGGEFADGDRSDVMSLPPTDGTDSGSWLFSTPDTRPEAPNTGSNRRRGPSGLGNQVASLPTPTARDWKDGRPSNVPTNALLGRAVWALLPTPTVVDHGNNKTPDEWDAWTDAQRVAHGNGNGHGKSLSIETHPHRFGPYQAAVDRWASVLGRPAPEPTTDGRLNPLFVEWMMGLPEGWVTDPDLDLSRTAQLRMLGNGVVPQAGVAAYTQLLDRLTAVAA